MKTEQGTLTKLLALIGTILVWLPLAAPFVFSIIRLAMGRRIIFDYLMPAELTLFWLAGAGLLCWAAIRYGQHLRWVTIPLVFALGFLVTSQLTAVATRLASGTIEPVGWPMTLTLGLLIVSYIFIAALGIAGSRLLRELYSKSKLLE